MIMIGVDPGTTESGYVIYNSDTMKLYGFGKIMNMELLARMPAYSQKCKVLAIEMPASFGMPVGYTTLDTCRWVGVFQHAFGLDRTALVYRKKRNQALGIDCTCLHLCKDLRAKDSNIIKAISERFPQTGGGKNPVKGTKSQPGPLYGLAGDAWQALGVAITYTDQIERRAF